MILCVVGPTAVGKTKLSIALAKHYNGEIINADSVQVYKGLDIGSAKVTQEEMANIPHHLLDIVDVTDDYTIFHYQKDCREQIANIKQRNKIPILVGGSGLYIKAALYDYKLSQEKFSTNLYEELSNEEIYAKIMNYDKRIVVDKNNRRRLVRLLNKIENNDYTFPEKSKLLYDDVIFIGLKAPRDILYSKINERFNTMLDGLVKEMQLLYDKYDDSKVLQTAIGYKELIPYFKGLDTLSECVEKIKKNTRNYAKRQYTFFNHQLPVVWFDVNYENFSITINQVITYIDKLAK